MMRKQRQDQDGPVPLVEGAEVARRLARQWLDENELVPLVLIALEVDEPVEPVADRFGDAVQLDDVGMRAVPAAAAREFLADRAEQAARMEDQFRRLQETHEPSPVAVGVPAQEGLTPLESLMAADAGYVTPQAEFAGRPKPNFPAGGARAGSAATGRRSGGDRGQEGEGPMTAFFWVQPKGLQSPSPGTTLHVVLEQIVDGRPLHSVGRATVYPGNQVCVRLPEGSVAGRLAAELLREELVDPVYWGTQPTLRLK